VVILNENKQIQYLGWCPDLAQRLNIKCSCCTCCHEDDHNEYSFLGQIEFDDGYYDCCCSMRNIIDDK
jgi:hypothetical protein